MTGGEGVESGDREEEVNVLLGEAAADEEDLARNIFSQRSGGAKSGATAASYARCDVVDPALCTPPAPRVGPSARGAGGGQEKEGRPRARRRGDAGRSWR